MNHYSGEPMFIDPKVEQYGSHMIMSNVVRPARTSFVNIDTRFCDDFVTSTDYSATVSLPDKLCDVAAVRVAAAEVPMSFYTVSASLGNSFFAVTAASATAAAVVTVADGCYTTSTLAAAVNAALTTAGLTGLTYSIVSNLSKFTAGASPSGTYTFAFDTDATGVFDKYDFKGKMGWMLGFRAQSYTLASGATLTSPSFVDTNPLKYIYVAVDDFSGSARPAMQGAVARAFVNKRIIARIAPDAAFGGVALAHASRGTLVSDRRTYAGKTDIQRLSIQLVSPTGLPLNLNGLDFSLVLEVEHC
jgi:hypothetical protein